jgi:NADH dehydrogenase
MFARIYRPAKTAMQSGVAKTHDWVLEYAPEQGKTIEPLMGWTGSGDTREAAEDYARRHGIPYQVSTPKERKPIIRAKGYGANFATERKGAWTH